SARTDAVAREAGGRVVALQGLVPAAAVAMIGVAAARRRAGTTAAAAPTSATRRRHRPPRRHRPRKRPHLRKRREPNPRPPDRAIPAGQRQAGAVRTAAGQAAGAWAVGRSAAVDLKPAGAAWACAVADADR